MRINTLNFVEFKDVRIYKKGGLVDAGLGRSSGNKGATNGPHLSVKVMRRGIWRRMDYRKEESMLRPTRKS